MALYRAAGREFRKDGFLDARLREVEALGASGMGAYQGGRLEESEAHYREAITRAETYRHSFNTGALKLQLALVHADREHYAQAIALTEEVGRDALARGKRDTTDHFLLTLAHISTASYEVDAGNVGAAEAAIEKAGVLLDMKDHWRYRGYWHMNRGRLKALDDPFRNREEAFAEFDAADRCFHSRGNGDLLGLARTVLYRGALHLKLREVRDARARIEECRCMAGIAGFHHVQSDRLLLQSELLLERGIPAPHQIHEDVLRNLGAARMLITRFKVIANLYIYSWDLRYDVDMTVQHLEQINQMSRFFDRATFQRLYDTYVFQKVMARLWPGGGPLPPPFKDAEESGPRARGSDRGSP
jgi:tetratricopeptide (TPR) repeat protein